MRLFITGGSSYLGQHLLPLAVADPQITCRYSYFSSNPTALPNGIQLDITDATAVADAISAWQPDVIIHTIGSNRPVNMTTIIEQGTTAIRDAAAQCNARLIHLSTDALFDGTKGPYTEADVPTPVNPYGHAKAAAEQIVATYANHVIVRTSLIYGMTMLDHGTAGFAAALQARKPLTLFTDQLRSPVWVEALSRACLELINHPFCGILNVAGGQHISRAAFAVKLLDWWQIEGRERVILAEDITGRFPKDCRLDITLATQILQTKLVGVDAVLAQHSAPKK